MIVLDTHAWVWWVNGTSILSRKAHRAIGQATRAAAVFVSSISVWEVAQLVSKHRLELEMSVESWVAKSDAMPFLHFVPVDNSIFIKSVQLPGDFQKDPADRIIVATATVLGFPLVTRDRRIPKYPHVKTLW